MATISFELVADALAFPEGPVVMADGSVIVVELVGGAIRRCWGEGRSEVVATPGGGPNGAAIGPDGALYVCNNGGLDLKRFQHATGPGHEGRIERIDLATGRVERLFESWRDRPLSAPNDIVFDRAGGFWFTDLGKVHDGVKAFGALYRAMPDGSAIERIITGVVSYNGVGLSPDGATVYVADTHSARLYAFDAEGDTIPARPRLIGTAPGLVGLDSLAVTAAGNICVARLEQGGIVTFSPDGATSVIAFPDPYTTNIAFGGADMRTAWITQSTRGQLIRCRWPEPGLRLVYNG